MKTIFIILALLFFILHQYLDYKDKSKNHKKLEFLNNHAVGLSYFLAVNKWQINKFINHDKIIEHYWKVYPKTKGYKKAVNDFLESQ